MTLQDGENYIQVGEAQLWSYCAGARLGIPVLVFNGGPGCDDYLGPVAELIEDQCRVIRFEPRGCGRSTWDKNYSLEVQVNDADAVRQSYGHEQILLLGHSHGPNVALAYAIRFPQNVLGIIGITGGKVVDDRSWSAIYHERLESVHQKLSKAVFTSDPEVNAQGNQSWRAYCRRPELLRELLQIQAKTMFINAADDLAPNWPTQQLANLLPNARYTEVEGAGHHIWVTHPKKLKEELKEAVRFIMSDRL